MRLEIALREFAERDECVFISVLITSCCQCNCLEEKERRTEREHIDIPYLIKKNCMHLYAQ